MHDRLYVVRSGDTLSGIARRFYGRASLWPQIFVHNAIRRHGSHALLADPNTLRVGQHLRIPPRSEALALQRHPAQRTFPQIVHTRRAVPHLPMPSAPAPQIPTQQRPATAAPSYSRPNAKPAAAAPGDIDLGRTHFNSYAYKYELELLPPIKGETADYEFETKFTGQMYIWIDKQITAGNIIKNGMEAQAKAHIDTVFGQMINSGKVAIDWEKRRITYENLITMNAVGAPPSNVSVGVAVDSTNPNPALRAKFIFPELHGHLKPDILYFSRDYQVVVDVRRKIKPPQPPSPAPQRVTAPQQVLVATAAGSDDPWWKRPSILYTGAAVLVLATVASNVFTCGMDAEVDPAAGAASLRLLQMARGLQMARAVAH